MTQHFISVTDLSAQQIRTVLDRACALKSGAKSLVLEGKSVALLFQKPSLRTKISFDLAVHQLGGHPIYMGQDEVGLGTREPVGDVSRVLERYVDAIVARVFGHGILTEMAEHVSVPVINALSDAEHPCQVLADLQTLYERFGTLDNITLSYVGDGNNVATSLSLACATLGIHFSMASPEGYELPEATWAQVVALAQTSGAQVRRTTDPIQSVDGANALYTDVWASMGQEADADKRRRAFRGFQVDSAMIEKAGPGALFMHPLPAHYGDEVASGMQFHPSSVVFDQAENRLHAQKAILELILSDS